MIDVDQPEGELNWDGHSCIYARFRRQSLSYSHTHLAFSSDSRHAMFFFKMCFFLNLFMGYLLFQRNMRRKSKITKRTNDSKNQDKRGFQNIHTDMRGLCRQQSCLLGRLIYESGSYPMTSLSL